MQTTDTKTPTMARLEAAVAHLPACIRAEQEAAQAEEKSRSPYNGAPIALSHAVLLARRARLIAEVESHDGRHAALVAGDGAPEEVAHPTRFGVNELAAALTPIALRTIALEEEIAQLKIDAKTAVDEMNARRAEVAADPSRPSVLGPPGPVPERMLDVLLVAERGRRAGRVDETRLALAAG